MALPAPAGVLGGTCRWREVIDDLRQDGRELLAHRVRIESEASGDLPLTCRYRVPVAWLRRGDRLIRPGADPRLDDVSEPRVLKLLHQPESPLGLDWMRVQGFLPRAAG